MKQVVQLPGEKTPRAIDLPVPTPGPEMVQVRLRNSLISTGTELASVAMTSSSLVGKARRRPDLVRQVIGKVRTEGLATTVQKVRHRLAEPLALGYSAAGIVIACGDSVTGFAVGDRVAVAGVGYASHAEIVTAPTNLCCPLPHDCDFESGAFVAVGAVALHGIRTLAPQIGETVAVVGLGLLGQLTVQMLTAQGCRVVGIDPHEGRRERARRAGATAAYTPTEAAAAATDICDGVLITAATSSNDVIETAAHIARDRAVVVAVGAVGMDIPRAEFYRKELQLRLARSYGPGRYDPSYEEHGNDYPIGHVRWTENRNMAGFLDLVATGRVDCRALITDRCDIADAADAYERLREDHDALAVVFTYGDETPDPAYRWQARSDRRESQGKIGVGFIGAGGFAGGVLIPAFGSDKRTHLTGVVTRQGISARTAGERHGFAWGGCDIDDLLRDQATEIVAIATPHRDHAHLAKAALQAGKTVFLEKPMATTRDEFTELLDVCRDNGGRLQMGFNRRYAPSVCAVTDAFAARTEPMTINYRIAAGRPPDRGAGTVADGGRLIGEVCHFVDTALCLTGVWPRQVWAQQLGRTPDNDGLALVVTFTDGSVAQITYTAAAAPGTDKERIETFADGKTALIDDFKCWSIRDERRSITKRLRARDKGHSAQIQALLDAYQSTGFVAGDFAAAALTTEVTFAARESLAGGRPIDIGLRF